MRAVTVSARASTAQLGIEVTWSPGLRTSPWPVTPAGVADRWRNIGSCQKPPWHNALQVEKMLRIAHKRTGRHRAVKLLPGYFGRSDRRAQGDCLTLRSIRPTRAAL